MMSRISKFRGFCTLAASSLLLAGLSAPAYAEQEYEVDDQDSSATTFGTTCFTSTFRILYQGDNYTACAAGPLSGILWNLNAGPRVSGAGYTYDNGALHCLYAKWADGAARWTSTRYEVDWNFTGTFSADNTYLANQQRDGGQWVRLGCNTAPNAGSFPAVRCSNLGVPAGRYAICDGIRITRERVSRGQITDEPGIDWSVDANASGVALSSNPASPTTLRTVSITCPAAHTGYVQAQGLALVRLYSLGTVPGNFISASLSVSSDTTFNTVNSGSLGLAQPTAINNVLVTAAMAAAQGVFACNGGDTVTVRLLGYKSAGASTVAVHPILSLNYFPTQY